MAGITTTWDIAVPTGGEDPKNGDNRIVELKTSLEEIFRNGGHRLLAGPSTDSKLGRHVCDEEFASGGAGTPLTGEWYVYAKDGTTRIVTVRDSSAATPSEFNISTLKLVTGTHKTLAIPIGGGSTGVVGGLYFENRGTPAMTILGAKLVAGTAPSGTSLVVNVFRLASGYTDPGSGGTSILTTPASDLTIAAGSKIGTETTAIVGAQSVLSQGDALYFSITTLSAADNIVLYIRYKS